MHVHNRFDCAAVLHRLVHYLPSQAPLKDFVHHNTLHAFQHLPFHEALQQAACAFGYRTYLDLATYRDLYAAGRIPEAILQAVLQRRKGEAAAAWKEKLLQTAYSPDTEVRIGQLRALWKKMLKVNLDKEVHPVLFRMAGSYLDQGISIWPFPVGSQGFLAAVFSLERHSYRGIFRSPRVKAWARAAEPPRIEALLDILIGNPDYYEQYLFDQQFAHPGWSGMVAFVGHEPGSLLDQRQISLADFIRLELMLEIDFLDQKRGQDWEPLGNLVQMAPMPLLGPVQYQEIFDVYACWQEALEWAYYDQVLRGLLEAPPVQAVPEPARFQAVFCIDDREGSLRRHLETLAPGVETFGTAGFFNVAFYFQPAHGKFFTKVCPGPITPQHLIKEEEGRLQHERDAHFSPYTKGLVVGWLISQTMGFWSAVKMAGSIFLPRETPVMVSSFKHMDKGSRLTVACTDPDQAREGDLQVGFTWDEMADRVAGMLKEIGLVRDFAPLVYLIGHGASSVNNTHYAGYDCGACSGRAGSANARAAAYMANHPEVRARLAAQGLVIPAETQFLGGLHDTTRDEIAFYDEDILHAANQARHAAHLQLMEEALHNNAKERARRFLLIDTDQPADKVHAEVKRRSLSLFEPRPEWNHATNALCIVGRRETNRHLFLDRRAFLNSYDYRIDPEGASLLGILRAVVPVCGGINLEYYFSRVDNYRLGAGSKLPHNVVGLIGVANGMDGDLRPGLPQQMVNIHDPLRLMMIVEQRPEVVLRVIQQHEGTYEWFRNGWVHLAVIDPVTRTAWRFEAGQFHLYQPLTPQVERRQLADISIHSREETLPVFIIH